MKVDTNTFQKKAIWVFLVLFLMYMVFIGFYTIAYAAPQSIGGFGTAVNTGSPNCAPGQLCNPIGSKTLDDLVVKITTAALKIGVPIAALFIMWAGFKYVTAAGDETAVKAAHAIFWWTLVGTAILLAASLLATVLTGTITEVIG